MHKVRQDLESTNQLPHSVQYSVNRQRLGLTSRNCSDIQKQEFIQIEQNIFVADTCIAVKIEKTSLNVNTLITIRSKLVMLALVL